MTFINFNCDYFKVLTIQVDICFPNLYFGPVVELI